MSGTRDMNPHTTGGRCLKFVVGIGDSVKLNFSTAYKKAGKYPLDTYPLKSF